MLLNLQWYKTDKISHFIIFNKQGAVNASHFCLLNDLNFDLLIDWLFQHSLWLVSQTPHSVCVIVIWLISVSFNDTITTSGQYIGNATCTAGTNEVCSINMSILYVDGSYDSNVNLNKNHRLIWRLTVMCLRMNKHVHVWGCYYHPSPSSYPGGWYDSISFEARLT